MLGETPLDAPSLRVNRDGHAGTKTARRDRGAASLLPIALFGLSCQCRAMFESVSLPLWLVIVVIFLAAVAALDRIIGPSLRWFLRRRMERAVEELNKRLERPIQPFKLMRRQDMIVRLIYDPQVMEGVVEHAQEHGVPESVAFQRAQSYAREIVPGFSTSIYFGFAMRLARMLSDGLYSVRVRQAAPDALRAIDKRAAVVFVINHRSNMDYVLVTYLAAQRSALSYAVGEWARVWPLQSLFRAMGAYFIRRRYLSPLYRRVLSRYVQMATKEGVTQAIFPEGGLSLDGRLGTPKKGLLHYIVSDFDLDDGRDVVFIPVAVNYDRVIEDRVLTEAQRTGERRFRARFRSIVGFILRYAWLRLRGRFHRFGRAAVSYGLPLSLEDFLRNTEHADTDLLARTLMDRIAAAVPILPVPMVAAALLAEEPQTDRAALTARIDGWIRSLQERGADANLPDGDASAILEDGLASLQVRGLVTVDDSTVSVVATERQLVAFYASSVQHLLDMPGHTRDEVPAA